MRYSCAYDNDSASLYNVTNQCSVGSLSLENFEKKFLSKFQPIFSHVFADFADFCTKKHSTKLPENRQSSIFGALILGVFWLGFGLTLGLVFGALILSHNLLIYYIIRLKND